MPDPEPTLRGRLPSPFPLYDDSTDFENWLDAHQTEVDTLADEIGQVENQIHIGTATGQELDLIGEEYGLIGRRRGRDDDSYRSFLISLVASFQGVGTIPGVKEAISSGLLVDDVDVELIEDFAANKYEVKLYDWTAHKSGTVRTLADLADPLAIARRDPVHNILATAVIGIHAGDVQINSGSRSETVAFGIDGDDTQHQTVNSQDTFGTGRFDGDGSFS